MANLVAQNWASVMTTFAMSWRQDLIDGRRASELASPP
jgi:hypothetical protein